MMKYTHVCFLLTCIAGAVADLIDSSLSIFVPSTVEAGTPFNATINLQYYGLADSSYAYAFRIYLGTSYKDRRSSSYDTDCQ